MILAFALVLMLSSLAMAVPESTQLGPYVVNFDMNTDLDYQLMPLETGEAETFTVYGVRIFTDNTTAATLVIREFKEPIDSTLEPQKQISILSSALAGFNVTGVNDITIDGKEGYMISSVPFSYNTNVPADTRLYEAVYWLDSEKCECGAVSVGTASIGITSSYPEEVSRSLIDSLVVTMGQATPEGGQATAESGQVLPPA